MKTYMANNQNVEHKWLLIDAQGETLGRLATRVATYLRGKNKPFFTPHVDCGDYVVIVNAEKIQTTGNKLEKKKYFWHTGYPGGIKSRSLADMLSRSPERVIELAVKRMLPKGPLGRQVFRKLKVYSGDVHPHEAQSPERESV